MSSDEFPGKPLSLAQACARLRFRHLQFLDILGRTRNLRLTAEQMHVTQPAATKILMDIEEVLEARLFDRLSRGMRPNELGLFTLRYASAALDGQRKFVDEFNALKQGGHRHVTVGAITGSAAHVLVASVVEIQRLRPLRVIRILEQSSDQLIAWLAERKIDLMIGRFATEDQRSQFHYEHLSAEPLHVVGGQHHPLRGATDLSLTELAHWPWILYPASTAVRKVSDDLFGGAGLALTAGGGGDAVLFVCAGADEHHPHDVAAARCADPEICGPGPALAHPRRAARPHAQLWPHHPPGRAAHALGAGLHRRTA
mgnify:CR=1 FL=1